MVQAGASGQEWAVLVALLRWQGNEGTTLNMGVETICKYTGLDEDTVRHRLASLMRRVYVSKGGNAFSILEYALEAKRGKSASYRLGVPRREGQRTGPTSSVARSEWSGTSATRTTAWDDRIVIPSVSGARFAVGMTSLS